jgi:hypothetical protein
MMINLIPNHYASLDFDRRPPCKGARCRNELQNPGSMKWAQIVSLHQYCAVLAQISKTTGTKGGDGVPNEKGTPPAWPMVSSKGFLGLTGLI